MRVSCAVCDSDDDQSRQGNTECLSQDRQTDRQTHHVLSKWQFRFPLPSLLNPLTPRPETATDPPARAGFSLGASRHVTSRHVTSRHVTSRHVTSRVASHALRHSRNQGQFHRQKRTLHSATFAITIPVASARIVTEMGSQPQTPKMKSSCVQPQVPGSAISSVRLQGGGPTCMKQVTDPV